MSANESRARLSDVLFTTSIATYAVAMCLYTAEYAFGRKGYVASTAAATLPRRELVRVGGVSPRARGIWRDGRDRRYSATSPVPAFGRIDTPVRKARVSGGRLGVLAVVITVIGVILHGCLAGAARRLPLAPPRAVLYPVGVWLASSRRNANAAAAAITAERRTSP